MNVTKEDVERVCVWHADFLARADEAVESATSLNGPFTIGPHTFAYYQALRNHGHDAWVVALEDQVNGDGILIDSNGRLPFFSTIPVKAIRLAELGVAEREANLLDGHPSVPGQPVDLDQISDWLKNPRLTRSTIQCICMRGSFSRSFPKTLSPELPVPILTPPSISICGSGSTLHPWASKSHRGRPLSCADWPRSTGMA